MERKVRSECVNASNPFHVCADYCAHTNSSSSSSHSKPPKINAGRGGDQHRHVDPTCANASNPFHQCSDYCRKTPDANKRLLQVPKSELQLGKESSSNGGTTNVEQSITTASLPQQEFGGQL